MTTRLCWITCIAAVSVALGCSSSLAPITGVDAALLDVGDGASTDSAVGDAASPNDAAQTDGPMDALGDGAQTADSVSADSSAGDGALSDVSCAAGQTACGANCTTLASDPQNCGACGSACVVANATAGCAAGVCTVVGCNAGYADCNAMASDGCEAMTATDPSNCGACGNACTFANAMAVCTAGSCAIGTCNTGYADCNMMTSDGCETNTATTVTSCGACGMACSLAHATAGCAHGACTVAACNTGYGDCDSNPANGCEAPLNTNANCGGCGTACGLGTHCSSGMCVSSCPAGTTFCTTTNICAMTATDTANCGSCSNACPMPTNASPTCAAGTCGMTCSMGYADCNAMASDGCEINLGTSAANCGTCGHACMVANASPSCSAGSCTIGTCNAGYADCNANPVDGCEINTRTSPANCGACGNACSVPNAVASCTAGACTVGTCNAGWADCDGLASNGCERRITTNTDCGSCGHACGTGTYCSGSACVSSCPAGSTYCASSNACAVFATDPRNCGMCGTVCPTVANSSAECSSGVCGFVCSTGYANCDGVAANGCEVNVTTSVANCGACGAACSLANATAACSGGACNIASCNAGWGNCDGIASNGCEANLLTSPGTCGSCSVACALANATSGCTSGACSITACNTGYGDCNHLAADGCEASLNTNTNCGACGTSCASGTFCSAGTCVSSCTAGTTYCAASGICANTSSDPANCGSCGHVCPSEANAAAVCTSGTCGIVCNPGYGNCDGILTNGCETNLNTTTTSCGSCGTTCSLANATAVCVGGGCAIGSCNAGYGDCDGIASNGCETNLNTTPTSCGTCTNVCNLANATADCSAGSCTVASCTAGYGNCDGIASNGCETALDTNSNCGVCGTTCGAGTFCSGSTCVSSCSSGTTYCTAYGACFNLATDPSHCGSCSNTCPSYPDSTSTCTAGTCGFTCLSGYGNCDGVASNGCETNLETNVNDCGACGNVCSLANATPVCSAGTCQIGTCNHNYGNCDGITANGCETNLQTSSADCGHCGHACGSGQSCYLGRCI